MQKKSLKSEILQKFGTLQHFQEVSGIPRSSVNNWDTRGIETMTLATLYDQSVIRANKKLFLAERTLKTEYIAAIMRLFQREKEDSFEIILQLLPEAQASPSSV